MKRTTIIEIISSLFILLFVYTAVSKLLEVKSFATVLNESPLLNSFSGFISYALPITELMVSLLLFIPRTRLWGFYGAAMLMTLFTLYLGYMIYFTPKLPCSCGGVLGQMTWKQHLVFNVFFLLLSLVGIILKRKNNHHEKRNSQELPPVIFT